MNYKAMVSFGFVVAAMHVGAVMVVGDANTTTVVTPSNTIITATKNATLTVTDPGEIEILLVGGGGGAGGSTEKMSGYTSGDSRGGGGGGGGVIHKTNFHVEAGSYQIDVGAGGAVNQSNDSISSATGGETTGFGLMALGGGPGGCVNPTTYYTASSLAGASGGGGSKGSKYSYAGGSSLASAENQNLGHSGGNALDNKTAGGGGGAGTAGTTGSPVGGDGYACDISGDMVHYGGGGGGGRRDSSATAQPGLGGGKSSYGGGGTAQIGWGVPESGGPGIVIVRFTRTEQKTSNDFTVYGYDAKGKLDDGYAYLVITNDTTLQVTGSASFDVLLVGGGGGAGANSSTQTDYRGGGGGGGGVIYVRNIPVTAGDYAITVGLGGAVNTGAAATTVNGGNTTAFGFTALGGGPGAPATGYGAKIGNIGASGGGGATDGAPKEEGKGVIYGGTAKASAENFNLGNAGADAYTNGTAGPKYNGGAGGGAGSAAVNGVGGDGYACDITGTMVYYGGGGAGGKRYNSGEVAKPGLGGGKASWGGGGSGQYGNSNAADGFNTTPQAGGHGIVIIRYKRVTKGTVISFR